LRYHWLNHLGHHHTLLFYCLTSNYFLSLVCFTISKLNFKSSYMKVKAVEKKWILKEDFNQIHSHYYFKKCYWVLQNLLDPNCPCNYHSDYSQLSSCYLLQAFIIKFALVEDHHLTTILLHLSFFNGQPLTSYRL
jgi:hypothetical protein